MSDPNTVSRFDEIYNSTSKAVLAFITSKCVHTADINDIFQDTYMDLYKTLTKRGADYVTNEKAFVLRIAKCKVARYYSLIERMRIFVSTTFANDNNEEVELTDFEADAFLTEDFIVNQETLETSRKIIQSKPEDVQKVFYLFYDVGLSIPEIAQALSLNESSVKNKLYRTLKQLRDLLN